jgi:hypothetical protein
MVNPPRSRVGCRAGVRNDDTVGAVAARGFDAGKSFSSSSIIETELGAVLASMPVSANTDRSGDLFLMRGSTTRSSL